MATQNSSRTIHDSADQVFLSPRVIDRSAFEEFASQLRTLMEQATSNAKAVEEASQRAVQVHARLAESGPALEARISAATTSLAGAESRAIEVQNVLSRASQHAADSQAYEARLALIASERAVAFESALTEAALRHRQQLQSIEEDFRRRLANTTAHLSSELDEVSQRTHALEARTAELADRIATLSREAGATFGEATSRLEALVNAAANADQQRLTLSQASTDAIGTIERSLATRDALTTDVAILTRRIYELQKTLTGTVIQARQATLEARVIELKPLRRRKGKTKPAKAAPAARRALRKAA